jgi:hypothetical protein
VIGIDMVVLVPLLKEVGKEVDHTSLRRHEMGPLSHSLHQLAHFPKMSWRIFSSMMPGGFVVPSEIWQSL